MEGDDVRLPPDGIQVGVLRQLGHLRVLVQVVSQHPAAKAGQVADDGAADLAGAQHRHGGVGQLLAHLPLQGEVLDHIPVQNLPHLPAAHEHEHDGVVGHPAGGIEHVGHRHAQLLGGGQVEVVEPDGPGPQVLHPQLVEAADGLRPQGVGGGADGVVAPGQLDVLRGGILGAVRKFHPQLCAPLVKQGLLVKLTDGVGKQLHLSRARNGSAPLSPLFRSNRDVVPLHYSPFSAGPQVLRWSERGQKFFALGCTGVGNCGAVSWIG